MVNNISMPTMHFSACLPPPLFFLLVFFFFHTHTHIHNSDGGKNDLSAALNSLHFYRLEWTGSTKGDIIFSGFDWTPPCHKMTSCNPCSNTLTPTPPAPSDNYPHPYHYPSVLGCWVVRTTAPGPDGGAGLGTTLQRGHS